MAEEEKDEVGKDIIVKNKIPATKGQPGFTDIERRIMAFFAYLDQQPYVQSYEYAGYILNTLGGRSYLLRRNMI